MFTHHEIKINENPIFFARTFAIKVRNNHEEEQCTSNIKVKIISRTHVQIQQFSHLVYEVLGMMKIYIKVRLLP
jgi:hypothetical protein